MIASDTYQLDQYVKQDTLHLLAQLSTEQRANCLDAIYNAAHSLDQRIKNKIIKDLDNIRTICDREKWPMNRSKLSKQQIMNIYLVLVHKIVGTENDEEGNFITKTYQVIQVTTNQGDAPGENAINYLRNLRTKTFSQVIQLLRLLPITQKQSPRFKNGLVQRQDQFAQEAIEHELKRLYQNEFKKKGKVYPRLLFEKLNNVNSETITIFFSGFGSENSCKLTQWDSITSKVKTEAYAIRWESKSFGEMYEYGQNKLMGILQGTIKNLMHVQKDHPFLKAYQMAQITGQFLADFFVEHFKGFNLVLVGFSLGTELIKCIMERLQQLYSLSMLKQVVLMGGVADYRQIQRILQKQKRSQIFVYNFHNNNDSVLKLLLPIYKYQINPIGLNTIKKVPPHMIINQDCSDYVDGHGDYREKMSIIRDYVSFIYSQQIK